MVTEAKVESRAVLTLPLCLEGAAEAQHGGPNLLQRILSLFKNVRPGSDLTRFQLPPVFNMPKSHLQCLGESVYCIGDDMLKKCVNGKTSLERFTAVVGWSISTLRPLIFGVAPFNPILGETHHVSADTLHVLMEQISHHPPVSALHATDEKDNIEIIWCQHPAPKFYGTKVEAVVHGKKELKLLNYGETYVMESPKLLIRFFPVPGIDWVGDITIRCEESGLQADLCFRTKSFLGFGGSYRSVTGKIFDSSSLKTFYDLNGHWDSTITVKDSEEGNVTVIYNAKEAISRFNTPTVKDPKGLWASESAVVWGEVNQGILNKDWEKAREAKKGIEERERELLRERKAKGETWVAKHFTVSHTKEGGWECSPIHKWVPPAPIALL
ncbi:hypothetical protein HHK36_013500 [Tetracentron sinense]|uniref:Oxysterol-binding protein n=1 Tax=Tetracentron sinense TaxID=13715 RepID=A0A835DHE6_TETSI|nr:hypothetical protein HHK36_013500 [Tetracentron sinense]